MVRTVYPCLGTQNHPEESMGKGKGKTLLPSGFSLPKKGISKSFQLANGRWNIPDKELHGSKWINFTVFCQFFFFPTSPPQKCLSLSNILDEWNEHIDCCSELELWSSSALEESQGLIRHAPLPTKCDNLATWWQHQGEIHDRGSWVEGTDFKAESLTKSGIWYYLSYHSLQAAPTPALLKSGLWSDSLRRIFS